MNVYHYHPQPEGIDKGWKHAIQLYCYLYHNPDERAQIQSAINSRGDRAGKVVHIYHDCSKYDLRLRVGDTDYSFQLTLQYLLNEFGVQVPDPIDCMSQSSAQNPK